MPKNLPSANKKKRYVLFSAAITSIFAAILMLFEFMPIKDALPASTSPAPLGINSFSLYYLTLSKNMTAPSAQSLAIDQQAQDHGGFVLEHEGQFYSVSAIFENENDAVLVKNTLKNNNIDSEILKFSFQGFTVDNDYDAEQKKVLMRALKATYNTYAQLFDIAISLYTHVYNEISSRLEINSCHADFSSVILDINTIFNEKDEFVTRLTSHLFAVNKVLENLCSGVLINPTQTYVSLIKYRYCEIIALLKEYMQNECALKATL